MEAPDIGEDPVKIIYLVQRKHGTDRDAFVRRWRRHGALGMSMARWRNVKRYVHCDIRGELTDDGHVTESAFDGFGMSWFRSAAHRANHAADKTAQAAMVADERETFAQLVAASRLLTVEHPRFSKCDAVAVKAVRLIEWNAELDGATAGDAWHAHSRQLVDSHHEIARHVLNVVTGNAAPESPLGCDAVDELGFCTSDALRRFGATTDLTTLTDASGHPLGTARVFATTEVVLYDQDYGKPL